MKTGLSRKSTGQKLELSYLQALILGQDGEAGMERETEDSNGSV